MQRQLENTDKSFLITYTNINNLRDIQRGIKKINALFNGPKSPYGDNHCGKKITFIVLLKNTTFIKTQNNTEFMLLFKYSINCFH